MSIKNKKLFEKFIRNYPLLVIVDEIVSDDLIRYLSRKYNVLIIDSGGINKSIFENKIFCGILIFIKNKAKILNKLRNSLVSFQKKVPIFLKINENEQIFGKDTLNILGLKNDNIKKSIFLIEKKTSDYFYKELLPPFFKAILFYSSSEKYSWHTPGHNKGYAFLNTKAGSDFFVFLGKNFFKTDYSVSVGFFGSLLDHSKFFKLSEDYASFVFGDRFTRTYFVTNGTSTSNKIVLQSILTENDKILVDRNCHKSLLQSIILTRSTPYFLKSRRNKYNIICPFSLKDLNKSLKENEYKVLVLTNSTYDGIVYNINQIIDTVKHKVKNILFDEAWFAYGKFHDFYKNRYAMGYKLKRNDGLKIISTQSTHKLLTAFSQASMIHIKSRDLDEGIFNESYMMYTSTSPLYNIISSLDVSSNIMHNKGEYLVGNTLNKSILFRKKFISLTKLKNIINIWQPDKIKHVTSKKLINPRYWKLHRSDDWHGFKIEDEDLLLDPTKVTFLTKIPSQLITKFLEYKYNINIEKNNLYSFLILFSLGTRYKDINYLINSLINFAKKYENSKFFDVFNILKYKYDPNFHRLTFKQMSDRMNDYILDNNLLELSRLVYENKYNKKLDPYKVYEDMVNNNIDKVDISESVGRVSAVSITPYPPGIPIIFPGEIINKKIVEYLESYIKFNNVFKGFEFEIHGLHGNKIPVIKNL